MLSTTKREAAINPARPARLELEPDRPDPTVLDGGWWPRSEDPATELPGLILALDERHGRIRRIMLGAADWTASRPRQLAFGGPAGGRVVHLGWFATQPAGLLTAISVSGGRTDLLTVPPDTSEPDAVKAMDQAAEAGNRIRTPALLAGMNAPGAPAQTTSAGDQLGAWEWEGGHLRNQVTEPGRPPSGSAQHPGLPPAGPETS